MVNEGSSHQFKYSVFYDTKDMKNPVQTSPLQSRKLRYLKPRDHAQRPFLFGGDGKIFFELNFLRRVVFRMTVSFTVFELKTRRALVPRARKPKKKPPA